MGGTKSATQHIQIMVLTKEQQELFESNKSLVPHVVFHTFNIHDEDRKAELCSIGYEALCTAITLYDENYGTKFSTFACRVIYKNILSHLRHERRIKQREIHIDELEEEIGYVDKNLQKIEDDDYIAFLTSRVKSIIGRLPKKNQDVFWSYVNGETQYSIAERWGDTHQNISLLLKNMRKKITIDKLDSQYNEV